MRHVLKNATLLFVLVSMATSVQAQSSAQANTYDALGRLVSVAVSGGSENGTSRTYSYDPAGNRTAMVADGKTSVMCQLNAHDAAGSDDGTLYPQVSVSGSCPETVTLSYTVQQVSGSGYYYVGGFVGDGAISSGETWEAVRISSQERSVPEGQTLILRVNWSVNSGNATVSPAYSEVTFYSSF